MFDVMEHYKELVCEECYCDGDLLGYTPAHVYSFEPLRGEMDYANFIKKVANDFKMSDMSNMYFGLTNEIEKNIKSYLDGYYGLDVTVNTFGKHSGDEIVKDVFRQVYQEFDDTLGHTNETHKTMMEATEKINKSQNIVTKKTVEEQTTPVIQKEQPVVKKPKKKFKIGEKYYLYPMRNKKLRREYEVKKTIYNIKDKEVNILIMKQTGGSETTKFTLNKHDCLKFHLKYEEGLEVFSMDLNWSKVK